MSSLVASRNYRWLSSWNAYFPVIRQADCRRARHSMHRAGRRGLLKFIKLVLLVGHYKRERECVALELEYHGVGHRQRRLREFAHVPERDGGEAGVHRRHRRGL